MIPLASPQAGIDKSSTLLYALAFHCTSTHLSWSSGLMLLFHCFYFFRLPAEYIFPNKFLNRFSARSDASRLKNDSLILAAPRMNVPNFARMALTAWPASARVLIARSSLRYVSDTADRGYFQLTEISGCSVDRYGMMFLKSHCHLPGMPEKV